MIITHFNKSWAMSQFHTPNS